MDGVDRSHQRPQKRGWLKSATRAGLLDSISAPAREVLVARSVERRFAKDEILWNAGDPPKYLAVVIEGNFRIIRSVAGRQTVIHGSDAGSTLGEIPFFTHEPYPATAIATEASRVLLITYPAIEQAIRLDGTVAMYFLGRLSRRVKHLVDRIAGLSSQSVDARLATYILERIQDSPDRLSGSPFSLGMTQSALAEELGTVREVVVRSLRSLRTLGAIEAAGSARYRVANIDVLRSLTDVML
jgi:CRP-like cAMP-binding protein